MDLYKLLGVDKKADKATIKKAFKSKSSKAHPDRKGGDSKVMAELNAAYDVLSDDAKRKRYDASGDTSIPKNPRQMAEQGIMVLLMAVLQGDDEFNGDIIAHLKKRVDANSANIQQGINQARKRIAKMERMLKRLSGPLVASLIEEQVQTCKAAIERGEEQLETDRLVLELLAEYKDSWKPGASQSPFGDPSTGLEQLMADHMNRTARGGWR